VAFLQKYQDDLADLPDNKGGLQSTLYSLLTISLVASGAAYLLQPQVHCLHSMLCAEYTQSHAVLASHSVLAVQYVTSLLLKSGSCCFLKVRWSAGVADTSSSLFVLFSHFLNQPTALLVSILV